MILGVVQVVYILQLLHNILCRGLVNRRTLQQLILHFVDYFNAIDLSSPMAQLVARDTCERVVVAMAMSSSNHKQRRVLA